MQDANISPSTKKIKVTLKKSPIGRLVKHQRTVKALGLKKIGQTVEHNDNVAIRGMLFKVQHLVEVE
ncbi:MAG: 50S ribosomal protein L30 [Firmicutes bacterium]|nr:50S ribosomal protein L30 [Bacillota bacterium]MCL1954192.1 50S ribosomal protein L30 [Bacillota bacterium]